MMPSTTEEDPFLQVQQFPCGSARPAADAELRDVAPTRRDVLNQLDATRPLFASYLRIRSLRTSGASPELTAARADLETALAALAEDLGDLVASVQAIESRPAQFGLTSEEMTRRKRVVQEVGGEVEDMRDELAKKIDASEGGIAGPSSAGEGGRDGGSGEDDVYAEFERQQQLDIMHEQDQHLDGVFQTVGNLRRQADDMGRELEEQREMLELVDETADRVGGRLENGMRKLKHVMRRNEDRWSSCCIAVLIFVLILLLFLLIIV